MTDLRIGYSPCPNDTFLFHPMVSGLVDTEGYVFEAVLEDVETLNLWALEGRLPMTKASYGALGALRERYWCLRSGGALGRGCGPLIVTRPDRTLESLRRARVAVPGMHTTANLLLGLYLGGTPQRVSMVFHEIMPAVAAGTVDAGLVIHESRFTYPRYGLVCLQDLGEWWEQQTGLPLPLGGIFLRRDLPGVAPAAVQRVLRRSVEYAIAHPEACMDYVRAHAQEMDDGVIREHIGLYVNDYSVDVGDEGVKAVHELLRRARFPAPVAGEGLRLFPPPLGG